MTTKNPTPLAVCEPCGEGQHEDCTHETPILPDPHSEEPPCAWHCTCGNRGHSLDSFPKRKR